MNERVNIGHNQPPDAFADLDKREAELVKAAGVWETTKPVITTEDESSRLSDFIDQMKKFVKSVEDKRLEETRPLDERKAALMTRQKKLCQKISAAITTLNQRRTAYLQKKEDERKAEAQRAEQEKRAAEEAARKAAAEAETGGFEAKVAAEEAAERAEQAKKDAARIANSRTQTKGNYASRAASLRTYKYATIKPGALGKAFKKYQAKPELCELLERFATADARAGEILDPEVFAVEERANAV